MHLSHEQMITEKKLYVLPSGRAEFDGLNNKKATLGVIITKHLNRPSSRISVSNHPSTLLWVSVSSRLVQSARLVPRNLLTFQYSLARQICSGVTIIF